MARDAERRCPICLDSWHTAACTLPCLHRFCFSCIQRWTDIKAQCPLCKRPVTALRHWLRGDEFQDCLPSGPQPEAESWVEPAEHQSLERRGGISPSDWAGLFRRYPHLCQRLRPWLQQVLGRLFQEDPWQGLMLEHMVLCSLPVVGLNEDSLAGQLQAYLQSRTRPFVRALAEYAAEQSEGEAHYFLEHGSRAEDSSDGSQDSWELSPVASTSRAVLPVSQELSPVASTSQAVPQGGSPVPAPGLSSSAAAKDTAQLPGTSTAALRGSPGCPPSIPIPIPGEQDQDLEVEEAATGAPAPSQGCSCQGPWHPPRRKPSSSGTPSKKPPRQ